MVVAMSLSLRGSTWPSKDQALLNLSEAHPGPPLRARAFSSV